jgi:pimeloyl-ACP methyl ester carboxylesterase
MTTIRKGYLDGPCGQIHYYEAGDGPTLILAHQSPVCGRMFERAMPLLAQLGLRAIAVDTPGFGQSDVPPSPPAIADYADVFVAVLDGLNLERAHFLGHHTGASILCNFAARYPARVDKLILNGPPLLSPADLEQFRGVGRAPHPLHADGSHLQEAWDRRVRYTPGWTDVVSMHRRLVDQLWAGDTEWYGHRAAFDYDMQPDFMALTGMVLILTNTGDDIYPCACKARSLRPDFAYIELEGGTHDIVDEQPQAWSEAVASFIHGA